MSADVEKATRGTGGAAKRGSAKPAGSAKRAAAETARVQLHFGKETVRRLGVHCSMKDSNWSQEVERVLLRFLVKEGRGRELFSNPAVDLSDEGESAALAG
jgi:hypothetical protein